MAPTHAMTGLLFGVASAPLVTDDLGQQLVWSVACTGAALLPDLDQRAGTASGMWGWVTRRAASGIGRVAGGHRGGTHDAVLYTIVACSWAFAAQIWQPTRTLLAAFLVGLSLSGLQALRRAQPGKQRIGKIGVFFNLLVSWSLAWPVASVIEGHWLLAPGAIAVGGLAHVAGDLLSKDGVPIPIVWSYANLVQGEKDRTKYRVRLTTFRTDSWFEHWVVIPAHALAFVGLLYLR